MRGALPIGLLLLSLTGGCVEQPAASPTPTPSTATPDDPSSWVPALTAQQEALVAPVHHDIKSPAQRVLPSLDRFGYSNNRPLADPASAVKFTRMVTKVLNDSPRFYAMEELPPGAENTIAQYGPPPGEPDGFKIVKRLDDGEGQLVPSPDADEARAALVQAGEARKAGDLERAIGVLRAAAEKAPAVPALRLALGDALGAAGRTPEAMTAYRELLAADPTFAPAHLALAELGLAHGDRAAARRSLVEALAYDPASTRGLELLRKVGDGGAAADGGWYDPPPGPSAGAATRIAPFALFLDVDAAGAIHVATAKSGAAQIYGGCRAVMRYEPAVRAQIFKLPREAPYFLSVAEEVVCLEAALGAYLAGKGEQGDDGALDQLLRIAREDGLSGYVMFEILGQHRPERARAAPPDVHRDMVAYLTRWVLSRHDPIPEGVYTAKR